MSVILKEDDIWALSITVTGRCNCNCSYCHFYATRNRKEYMIDISDELYDSYIKLIKYIKEHYHKNLQVRFSGGEPLVLGDRIFELSNRLYKETGIEPYILTNGKALSKEMIEKSKNSHIQAFLVSVENPFNPSKGAPPTYDSLEKIKQLDCEEVRVIPAIMIVKNQMFKHLYRIADYVYSEIGILPTFAELTYQAYESPSDEEINDLYNNIKKIAKEFYGKTPIRLFPYVSPELYANGTNNYLSELDLENRIGINNTNTTEVASKMFNKLNNSYKDNPCNEVTCDWYEDCKIIKWLWFNETKNVTVNQKLNDYCRFKKAVNNALFDGISEQQDV